MMIILCGHNIFLLLILLIGSTYFKHVDRVVGCIRIILVIVLALNRDRSCLRTETQLDHFQMLLQMFVIPLARGGLRGTRE